MHLEVSGQDGLDDEESESLHLCRLHRHEEVVLFKVSEKMPAGCSVVVLQHRPIIVQQCLGEEQEKITRDEDINTNRSFYNNVLIIRTITTI